MPERCNTAAIALGSNMASVHGGPDDHLREALRRLKALGTVTAVSSFHVTKPVGYLDQPDFLNAAALIETPLAPLALLQGLLAIEQAMGRDRTHVPPKGPRTIDLDLVLFNDTIVNSQALILPHPAMHERVFVLAPLAEIAPAMKHPVLGRTVAELRDALIPA